MNGQTNGSSIQMPNPPQILLVDDDHYLVDILKIVLKEEGFAPVACADGKQATELLTSAKQSGNAKDLPKMILLDLNMPVMDGWKVAEWLHADPVLDRIPLIVISATKEEGEQARALHSDAYLVKPFTTDELLGAVGLMSLIE